MFKKVKDFVKKYQYEIILIGGTAAIGAVATYAAYCFGKDVGYISGTADGMNTGYGLGEINGYSKGMGDALVDVSTGAIGGATFCDKTYAFTSTETTTEKLLASDPTLELHDNVYTSTRDIGGLNE